MNSSVCETVQLSATATSNPTVDCSRNDGPATAKLLGPKLTVLVLGMTRSHWPAERRFRRDEAASSGTVIDDIRWC